MDLDWILHWVRTLEAKRDGTTRMDSWVNEQMSELLTDPEEFHKKTLAIYREAEERHMLGRHSTGTPMTPEDAVQTMGVIESLRAVVGDTMTDVLTTRLLSDPANFWDEFFSALNPPRPETSALVVRTGLDATFGELADILEKGVNAR